MTDIFHKKYAAEYEHSSFTGVLDTPGVDIYYCASGPTTDLRIKAGMDVWGFV